MVNEMKMVMEKLDEIKFELDFIKKHVIDEDILLSQDDLESLREADQDLKKGRTRRLI